MSNQISLTPGLSQTLIRKEKILSIYFTAGFPQLTDTLPLAIALEEAGVQMIEIGMPYSDPIADGPTIQYCSQKALENGMTLSVLLEQVREIKKYVTIPVVLMGYLNPVLQYGVHAFLDQLSAIGIDGLILPDLPLEEYELEYRHLFEERGIANVFLISPQTPAERIRQMDQLTSGFLYLVSSNATTGATSQFTQAQLSYFQRIRDMKLKNPTLIGFGISNATQVYQAFEYHSGCIIGSAFLKALQNSENSLHSTVHQFIKNLKA